MELVLLLELRLLVSVVGLVRRSEEFEAASSKLILDHRDHRWSWSRLIQMVDKVHVGYRRW